LAPGASISGAAASDRPACLPHLRGAAPQPLHQLKCRAIFRSSRGVAFFSVLQLITVASFPLHKRHRSCNRDTTYRDTVGKTLESVRRCCNPYQRPDSADPGLPRQLKLYDSRNGPKEIKLNPFKMRRMWTDFFCVAQVLTALAIRGADASHLRAKETVHRVEKVLVTAQLDRRDSSSCATNNYLCPSSLNGGCCPNRYACETDSCVATTAGTTSACGRQAYHACGIEVGGMFPSRLAIRSHTNIYVQVAAAQKVRRGFGLAHEYYAP
jgi:hypothetical protein